jgi:hypothetical protein
MFVSGPGQPNMSDEKRELRVTLERVPPQKGTLVSVLVCMRRTESFECVIIHVNNQLDTLSLMYLFISPLYMFRTVQCSSSGDRLY